MSPLTQGLIYRSACDWHFWNISAECCTVLYCNAMYAWHVNVCAPLQNTFSQIFDFEAGDIDENDGYDIER